MRFSGPILILILSLFPYPAAADEVVSIGRPAGENDSANSGSRAHGLGAALPSEATSRPKDSRPVYRYLRTYSRGNDDISENQALGGAFETADMQFTVVVREDPDKQTADIWLVSHNTLSTPELKGAVNGLKYGLEHYGASAMHKLTPEEQQTRFEADTAAEILRVEKETARLRAKENELRQRIDSLSATLPGYQEQLKSVRAEWEEAVARTEKSNQKLGELIRQAVTPKAMQKLLSAQTEKLGDFAGMPAALSAKAEAEESIQRLTSLIARAKKAQAAPGTDARAEKLPIPHLRDNLLPEARKNLAAIEEQIETAQVTEEIRGIMEVQSRVDSTLAKISDTERQLSGAERDLKVVGSSTVTPRPVSRTVATGKPISVARPWVPYAYQDRTFTSDLIQRRPVNPQGKAMEAELHVGSFPVPPDSTETFEGTVGLSMGKGTVAKHVFSWRVNYENGKLVGATSEPKGGKDAMLVLTGSQIVKPDQTTEENAADATHFAQPFRPKPEPRIGRPR